MSELVPYHRYVDDVVLGYPPDTNAPKQMQDTDTTMNDDTATNTLSITKTQTVPEQQVADANQGTVTTRTTNIREPYPISALKPASFLIRDITHLDFIAHVHRDGTIEYALKSHIGTALWNTIQEQGQAIVKAAYWTTYSSLNGQEIAALRVLPGQYRSLGMQPPVIMEIYGVDVRNPLQASNTNYHHIVEQYHGYQRMGLEAVAWVTKAEEASRRIGPACGWNFGFTTAIPFGFTGSVRGLARSAIEGGSVREGRSHARKNSGGSAGMLHRHRSTSRARNSRSRDGGQRARRGGAKGGSGLGLEFTGN